MSIQPIQPANKADMNAPRISLLLLTIFLAAGCGSTPEQKQADQLRREEHRRVAQQRKLDEPLRRAYEEERKIVREQGRVDKENQHWRQVFAPYTDEQLRFKLATLNQTVNRDTAGAGVLLQQQNGLAFIIAKQELDSRIKERDAIGMELARRQSGLRKAPQETLPVGPSTWKASASGFFITEDGYLLTNFHVVDGASTVKVKHGGHIYDASVIRKDQSADLAVLKVAGDFIPLSLVDSRTVKLGERVFTLGFPRIDLQGEEPKFTDGSISSLFGQDDNSARFQISVPTQPGNSGGPLANSQGQVVGIIVSKLRVGQNVNYAIKSSRAMLLLDDVPNVKLLTRESHGALSPEEVAERLSASTALILIY